LVEFVCGFVWKLSSDPLEFDAVGRQHSDGEQGRDVVSDEEGDDEMEGPSFAVTATVTVTVTVTATRETLK